MKLFTFICALLVVIPARQIYASPCDSNNYDKAEYYAEKAGHEIVRKYGGGNDIRVVLSSCSYNSFSDLFKLNIQVYWNGIFFTDTHYNIDGELKMQSDGSNTEFAETYANDSVEDLKTFRVIVGGIILLGTLSHQN
ncbi:hypothetical protein TI04_09150 [Achromatium sp. WMS2]|nr:hypothetical protein TI04_09150 [Achromatium sp. WMS2]